MATIHDIAELSKTSIATVSHVLNGRGDERRISKATQERVMAVAERLNYRPNVTARQLKSTSASVVCVGLFWPEFSFGPTMVSIMRAIKNISALSLETIEISIHFFAPDKLNELWEKMPPVGFSGIVLGGASPSDLAYIADQSSAVPIVLVNRTYDGFPSVSIDHNEAGRLAADLIYRRRESSICAVWDSVFHTASNLRQNAFLDRCKELGIARLSQFSCEATADAGYQLGRNLVQNFLLQKVVYCNDESIAQGMLIALNESDLMVGRDIFLLTANNSADSFCRYMTPSLTAINLRIQEVFEQSMKLLLNIIFHRKGMDTCIMIPPKYVYRASMPELSETDGIDN